MRHSTSPSRKLLALALGGILAAAITGCGGDSGDEEGGGGGGTLVFGTSTDPVILDGAYVSDGESIRTIRQIFETLVTTKEGGTEPVPLLAKSWTTSPDGLTWTFTLQDGVKFHDGEPFNATAVCTNFDRWYNFKGVQQADSVAYYWLTVFGGFAKNESPDLKPSLYKSCAAQGDTTAVITLTQKNGAFLSGLTLPAFSIASPKALADYQADAVSGAADAPKFTGTFGSEHPIGTGPFKFESWQRGDTLTIARNDDYWGEKAKLDKVVFKPIAKGPDRRQALEAGDIDGYDLVDPGDVDALKTAGFKILERPAFNVGYIGFNQAKPPVNNPNIRQAIAYAINRQQIVQANYPKGAEVATQFEPPSLWGYNPDVPKYDYNPEKAKTLIIESGVKNPTLEFFYPTDVSRPYMPDPAANFQIMKANLEAVGFKVVPKAAKWDPDYLNAVDSGKAGAVHIIGWTGDYGDPDNFIGTFFGRPKAQFGFKDKTIQDELAQAVSLSDQAQRETIYKKANADIMTALPAIPYVHTKPNIAFKAGVTGYVPSPVNNEDFSTVSLPSG
jgi:peptide/nickel transport system substrate-binding protein